MGKKLPEETEDLEDAMRGTEGVKWESKGINMSERRHGHDYDGLDFGFIL
jgi:hypothetical protein